VNETPDTLENTAAKEPRSAEFQPEYLDPSSPPPPGLRLFVPAIVARV